MTRQLLLGALWLAPVVAAAQPGGRLAPDTTPVPRDLVNALLGQRYGPASRSTVVVGRLPASVPMDVIPPDVERILGGLELRDGPPSPPAASGGLRPVPGGTAIVVVPRAVAEPWDWLAGHARSVGFAAPASREEELEGFVGGDPRIPGVLCRDSTMLMGTPSYGARGERYLAISVLQVRGEYSMCGAGTSRGPTGPVGRGGMREWPAMPTLRMPPGVRATRSGSGSSGESRHSSARADVAGPPTELLAHFAKQLGAAGWTLGAPVSNTLVAVQTAQRRDEDGRTLFGILIVAVVPGTAERDLEFRMSWSPSPQR